MIAGITLALAIMAFFVAAAAYVVIKQIAAGLIATAPGWAAPAISCAGFVAVLTTLSALGGVNSLEVGFIVVSVIIGHGAAMLFLAQNGKWAWR